MAGTAAAATSKHSTLIVGLVGVLFGVLVLAVLYASPAAAHTDLASTDPPDRAQIADPVASVTLTFTGEVTMHDPGVEVLSPNGVVVTPTRIEKGSAGVFVAFFEPPLDDGTFGLRWSVSAADAHLISGGLSFSVEGANAEASDAVDGETGDGDDDEASSTVTSSPSSTTTTTTTTPVSSTTTEAEPDRQDEDDQVEVAAPAAMLDFYNEALPRWTRAVRQAGRTAGTLGSLVAVGALIFSARVLRDDRLATERPAVRDMAAVAGAVASIGAVGEVVALSEALSIMDLAGVQLGLALALRFAGGALCSTSGRWLGALLLVASWGVDGHSATIEPRIQMVGASIVHGLVAAVWVGGIVALVQVCRRRRSLLGVVGARFSGIAAASLAVAALSGSGLAILITAEQEESFWETLTTTPWGLILLGKLVVVLAAVCIGAYNRWILIRNLTIDASMASSRHFAKVVSIEAAVLLVVATITSFLIVASPLG